MENMADVSLDSLIEKVGSRYTLVVAAAKRARQLMNGDHKRVEGNTVKPVSIALEEISAGKIKCERTKGGIK